MRKLIYGVLAFMVVVPAVALIVARAMLPASSCEVTSAQVAAVKIETSYDDVRQVLGCDGVHTVDFEFEGFRSDTYRWRGAAWPYATFIGHFYNGILHWTQHVSLQLDTTWHKPDGGSPAAE